LGEAPKVNVNVEYYVSANKSKELNYASHVLIEKVISVLRNHNYAKFFVTLSLDEQLSN